LGEVQTPAFVRENKNSAPPTYIFHGPPPNIIAVKNAQKKVDTTKNNPEHHKSSRCHPRDKKSKMNWRRFQTPAIVH